jgi:hypothetical protein
MRKVIVAFEVPNFSEGAMRFISQMNDAERVTITALFLPKPVYAAFHTADIMTPGMFLQYTEQINSSDLNECVKQFKQYCKDYNLRYDVLDNAVDFGLPELKQQSRYADLIVLGGETFFNLPGSDKLSDYLTTSLHEAECPVVVAPERFLPPEYNIITFDGTESSARAIRDFAYLFPEMTQNPTTVVTFASKGISNEKNDIMIRELVSVHFPDHKFIHFGFDSNRYFSTWTAKNKAAIVICGAFGRSILSVLFKHSFITQVLKEQKLPVFISHK